MGALAVIPGLFGAVVGSFLNVVIHRLPRGESIVKPRSRCGSCGEQIAALDNIPLFSWALLRGRCRNCGERISVRYPVVELLTAVLFAAVVVVRGVHLELLIELPFAAMLIAVAVIDFDHKIVPNKVLLPAAVYGLVASAAIRPEKLPELLIAGAGAFTFLLVAALIHPKGMGMGDVKLLGVMGLYLGRYVIPAGAVGFLVGTVAGIAILARYGMQARKMKVPFGPFLALGGLVALLAGPDLVDLYRDAFLGQG
ncbi:MAG TPA: prepilin peptidase [Thermoleophilaceae bacterium]